MKLRLEELVVESFTTVNENRVVDGAVVGLDVSMVCTQNSGCTGSTHGGELTCSCPTFDADCGTVDCATSRCTLAPNLTCTPSCGETIEPT